MEEPSGKGTENSNYAVVASVLTIVSGALVLLLMTTDVLYSFPTWTELASNASMFKIFLSSLISRTMGGLLIGVVAIFGGAMVLAKKNLIFGVIGAAIPLGSSLYSTLYYAMLVSTGLITIELSSVQDYLEFLLQPSILVLSILAVVFFVSSRKSNVFV